MFYYIAKSFVYLYFLIFHGFTRKGLENFPKGRNVILASNHASYYDPPMTALAAYPHKMRFIAWEGLFKVPLLGLILKIFGSVPVNGEDKNSSASLLRMCMGFLKNGSNVFICPEGHRTETGELLPLEGGVAIMALKTGVPIVPTWCGGTYRAFPPHQKFPKLWKKVYVVFGKPIFVEELPQELSSKEKMALILEKINAFYVEQYEIDKQKYGGNK